MLQTDKDQLGYSSIKTTGDIYGHLVPGANRQAVNRLPVAGKSAPVCCQNPISFNPNVPPPISHGMY
jgi:hypothetical protein